MPGPTAGDGGTSFAYQLLRTWAADEPTWRLRWRERRMRRRAGRRALPRGGVVALAAVRGELAARGVDLPPV